MTDLLSESIYYEFAINPDTRVIYTDNNIIYESNLFRTTIYEFGYNHIIVINRNLYSN